VESSDVSVEFSEVNAMLAKVTAEFAKMSAALFAVSAEFCRFSVNWGNVF